MSEVSAIFVEAKRIPLNLESLGIRESVSAIVPASEILANIQKGTPIEYDHVTIKGDLDLDAIERNGTLFNNN